MVDTVCEGEYLVVGIEARRIPDLGQANIPGLKHFAIIDLKVHQFAQAFTGLDWMFCFFLNGIF